MIHACALYDIEIRIVTRACKDKNSDNYTAHAQNPRGRARNYGHMAALLTSVEKKGERVFNSGARVMQGGRVWVSVCATLTRSVPYLANSSGATKPFSSEQRSREPCIQLVPLFV